jgi:hypothetical protein
MPDGLSKTQKRREQRRKMRLATTKAVETATGVVAEDLSSAHITVAPLSSLSDRLSEDQYTALIGIMKGMKAMPAGAEGPRTPIYDNGMRHEDIRDIFLELFNDLCATSPESDSIIFHPEFQKIEQDQLNKFGPYRNPSWTAIREKLRGYYSPEVRLDGFEAVRHEIIARVADELIMANDGNRLAPTSVDEAYAKIPKNTFYGWPYMTSSWAQDDAIIAETIAFAESLMALDSEIVDEYIARPWVVFSRVVPDGLLTNKVRATMAPSKAGSVFEKCFTKPVIDAFRKMEWSKGYAGNHVIAPYIKNAVRKADVTFSADYSRFDMTCCREARTVVKEILQEAFSPEYHIQLEVMFKAFESPGVITPDGVYYPTEGGDFGLGSGIGPTGIIGSIWNRCCYYFMKPGMEAHGATNIRHFGYGDDTALVWNGPVIPVQWFSDTVKRVGMIMNPSKQEYSWGHLRFVSFLAKQYYWRPEKGSVSDGVYSLARAFTRLLFKDVQKEQTEKWVRDTYEGLSSVGCDMLDTVALLEETKGHPFHQEFVEFIRLGHPLRLKTSHYLRDNSGSGGDDQGNGLRGFKTVQVILKLEREGTLTGKEEENWQIYVLRKFATHIYATKGFLINASQAAHYLRSGKVEWNIEQLSISQAIGLEKRKPLSQRVAELEWRKGVILLPHQIEDLRFGRKIVWSKEQAVALNTFGNLTQAEKDLWRARISRQVTGRVLDPIRSEFDMESLIHDTLLLMKDKYMAQ